MSIRDRLYISTIGSDAPDLAREHSLGLELADFCMASNMDRDFTQTDRHVRQISTGVSRLMLHAPFSEMCPAAIDPLVRKVTLDRYRQTVALAAGYGVRKIVIHTGFIPRVYYPEWFIPESVAFWKDYLNELPENMVLCLENVMEPDPMIQRGIAEGVNDPRLRLCLDVGHAGLTGPDTLPDWIEHLSPWLGHVHLHNNDGVTDLHRPLGDGVLDMASLLSDLESKCTGITYTIENMAAADSVDWLREHGFL